MMAGEDNPETFQPGYLVANTDLFGFVKVRKPRRVLMGFYDAGQAPGMMPGWTTTKGAAFRCNRCGHDDGWTFNLTDSQVRAGIPCPICNEEPPAKPEEPGD